MLYSEYGVNDILASYMTYSLDAGFINYDNSMRRAAHGDIYVAQMKNMSNALDAILAANNMTILQLFKAMAVR